MKLIKCKPRIVDDTDALEKLKNCHVFIEFDSELKILEDKPNSDDSYAVAFNGKVVEIFRSISDAVEFILGSDKTLIGFIGWFLLKEDAEKFILEFQKDLNEKQWNVYVPYDWDASEALIYYFILSKRKKDLVDENGELKMGLLSDNQNIFDSEKEIKDHIECEYDVIID